MDFENGAAVRRGTPSSWGSRICTSAPRAVVGGARQGVLDPGFMSAHKSEIKNRPRVRGHAACIGQGVVGGVIARPTGWPSG